MAGRHLKARYMNSNFSCAVIGYKREWNRVEIE